MIIQSILDDFVYRDCRLADHPEISAAVNWLDSDSLHCIATTGAVRGLMGRTIRMGEGIVSRVVREKRGVNIADTSGASFSMHSALEDAGIQSFLCAPIMVEGTAVGTIGLYSTRKSYFSPAEGSAHISSALMLAGLLAYVKIQMERHTYTRTPAAEALGQALCNLRQQKGRTQEELAAEIGTNGGTLSRWESGDQIPSKEALFRWGSCLGLLASGRRGLVSVLEVSPDLLRLLSEDPDQLRLLTPSKFEQLVAERLARMGFSVTLTGNTFGRDGGIDLIAVAVYQH